MLIQWEKPDGTKLQTNDMEETIKYCESLGWKKKGEVREPEEGKSKPAPEAA